MAQLIADRRDIDFVLFEQFQIEDLFAHELAHQWWGNLVTPSTWRDIWLNEGFATYFDLLFTEHKYGWPVLQRRLAVLDSVYKSNQDLDHLLGDHADLPVARGAPERLIERIPFK